MPQPYLNNPPTNPPSPLRITEALDKFASTMSRSSVNWKTGTYRDANGAQKKLSAPELEKLRRERNRMHAKMTRDRKKIFVTSIKHAITKLESNNQLMRDALNKHAGLAQYSAEQERLLLTAVEKETFEISDEEDSDFFLCDGIAKDDKMTKGPLSDIGAPPQNAASTVSSSPSPVTTPRGEQL